MIDVVITLDQWGLGHRTDLVRIAIVNDATGTSAHGNYKYFVSHQERPGHDVPSAIDLARGKVDPWKWGYVRKFPRKDGAAKLLNRVLRDAFR